MKPSPTNISSRASGHDRCYSRVFKRPANRRDEITHVLKYIEARLVYGRCWKQSHRKSCRCRSALPYRHLVYTGRINYYQALCTIKNINISNTSDKEFTTHQVTIPGNAAYEPAIQKKVPKYFTPCDALEMLILKPMRHIVSPASMKGDRSFVLSE